MISAEINRCEIQMELDTGAAVTIVSERIYRSIPEVELHPCSTQLTSYTGGNIGVMGRAEVEVRVAEIIRPDVAHKLPIIIVEGAGQCLIGRDWLDRIKLNWENIFTVQRGTASVQQTASTSIRANLKAVLERHKAVFEEGLGTYSGPEVHIKRDPNYTPKFFKARPVPYAQREDVEKELARLQEENVIEAVTHSEWASPAVTVAKSDSSLRLCGDYKKTVNPACIVDQYPMPHIDDMFARLAGCRRYTKID